MLTLHIHDRQSQQRAERQSTCQTSGSPCLISTSQKPLCPPELKPLSQAALSPRALQRTVTCGQVLLCPSALGGKSESLSRDLGTRGFCLRCSTLTTLGCRERSLLASCRWFVLASGYRSPGLGVSRVFHTLTALKAGRSDQRILQAYTWATSILWLTHAFGGFVVFPRRYHQVKPL